MLDRQMIIAGINSLNYITTTTIIIVTIVTIIITIVANIIVTGTMEL